MRAAKRVLLLVGWHDPRLRQGIERYAEHRGWQFSAHTFDEEVIPWGWDGNGILAWLDAKGELAEFVAQEGKPTVDFGYCCRHLKLARVLEDTAATARLVADHFRSAGYRKFAFYSDAPDRMCQERGIAFASTLKRVGYNPVWLRWHESAAFRTDRKAWQSKREWLAGQLRRLAKPVGLFAANDGLALEVLETCETTGLVVPEDVAIVGVGDNLLAAEARSTPISSVDANLESIGYRGAALLDELMRGRGGARPAEPLRVPPLSLIVRKSSDMRGVGYADSARGLPRTMG